MIHNARHVASNEPRSSIKDEIDARLARWNSTEIWADPDAAKQAGHWGLEASSAIGYIGGQAQALLILAGTTYLTGDCSSSEELLNRADDLFASIGDELGRARVIPHRGFIWLEREDFVTALDAQSKALEVARRYGDIELEVELLNDMGTQFHYAGQMDDAIKCLYEALELARDLPTRTWEAYLTMNIGATSIERSEITESLEWIARAGQIFEDLGHAAGQSYVQINLAEVAERNGNLSLALDHLLTARSLVKDQSARAHILFEIGRLYSDLGDADLAIDAFRESAALVRLFHDEYQQSRAALADWQIARLTNVYGKELLAELQYAEVVFSRSGGSVRKLFRVYDALIDACRNLGELDLALDYSARAMEAKEQFWMNLAEQRSMLTSKLHQLGDAQAVAERERKQRREVEQLYQQNELLITQLREQSAMLERQATEDSLTLIGNRRYFDGHLERELVRAARFARPVSVALVDVDHFKLVNDQFTHRIGDQVLQHLARIMRNAIRETDFIARYGGEEFAVLFPESDLETASEQAESIRRAVEAHDWHDLVPGLSVTVSIGLVAGDGLSSFNRLMASADAMLYLAKHRGRNQVRSISMDESSIEPGKTWQENDLTITAERMQRFATAS